MRPRTDRPPAFTWVVGATACAWAALASLLGWHLQALSTRGPDLLSVGALVMVVTAFLAAVACARAASRSSGPRRLSWALIAAGTGVWAIGAAVSALQSQSPHASTSRSTAAFSAELSEGLWWNVFPIGVVAGLLAVPGAFVVLSRGVALLDTLMVAASIAAVSLLAPITPARLAAVAAATAAVVVLAHGTDRLVARVCLATGLGTSAVAAHLRPAFAVFSLIAALLLVGAAALNDARRAVQNRARNTVQNRARNTVQNRARNNGGSDAPGASPWRAALPLAPLVLAIAALALAAFTTGVRGSGGAMAAALALLTVAVAVGATRQSLFARENASLTSAVARRDVELRDRRRLDPLTGLPNRSLFAKRVEQALAKHRSLARPFAIVFCDLDAFKGVNDGLGHAAGDQLLKAVAARLATAVGPTDVLARIGGDEFAALLASPQEAERSTSRMAAALAAPFALGTHRIHARASFGVAAVAAGEETPTLDALLSRADVAMYTAKRSGGAQVAFHHSGMTLHETRDVTLHLPLAAAVDRDEITLAYQPIIELSTGLVAGFEALARWEFQGQSVPPDIFIPLARRIGLLPQLTVNLVERACQQVSAWSALAGHCDISIAVNISPDQIIDHSFVDQLAGALRRHRVEPQQIVLEITEEALLTDLSTAAEVTGRLQRLGVPLSLDDFGKGYSSLAHLHRIPLRTLKIDRAFVRRIDQDVALTRLVRGVMALSLGMGLRTIAEGIEQPAEEATLVALGCRFGQGYLYSRPLPPELFSPGMHSFVRSDSAALTLPRPSGQPAQP